MRSRQLETALSEFLNAAGAHLRAEVAAGAEVPFELDSRAGRRGLGATPLYCYRALTGPFIAEREAALKRLPGHAEAAKLLERFEGLDRYLLSVGGEAARAKGRARVRASIKALLEDVFAEQTDFELRPERLRAALDRLQQAASPNAGELTLVGTLHGLTITSPEVPLTKALKIAHPDALGGLPSVGGAELELHPEGEELVVIYSVDADDPRAALRDGRSALKDLLSALRLFGDGRVTLGALAWARIGAGPWTAVGLGTDGRPHGMLVVTADQEDELRAFCNLVARRAPRGNELAWALRRFELGCERPSSAEALSDYLLALRALLEPEGQGSGLLAGRLAALCATPERREELRERAFEAIALERELISGVGGPRAGLGELVEDLADHLRALLRDVICGHLATDLAAIADELLDVDFQEEDDGGPLQEEHGELAEQGAVAAPAELGEEHAALLAGGLEQLELASGEPVS